MNASDEVLRKARKAYYDALTSADELSGISAAFEVFTEANRMPVTPVEINFEWHDRLSIHCANSTSSAKLMDWLRAQIPQKQRIERRGERRKGREWMRENEFLFYSVRGLPLFDSNRRSGNDRRAKP